MRFRSCARSRLLLTLLVHYRQHLVAGHVRADGLLHHRFQAPARGTQLLSVLSGAPHAIPSRPVRPPPLGGLMDGRWSDPQNRHQPRRRVASHVQAQIGDPLARPTDHGAPTSLLERRRSEVQGRTDARDQRVQRNRGPALGRPRHKVPLEGRHEGRSAEQKRRGERRLPPPAELDLRVQEKRVPTERGGGLSDGDSGCQASERPPA